MHTSAILELSHDIRIIPDILLDLFIDKIFESAIRRKLLWNRPRFGFLSHICHNYLLFCISIMDSRFLLNSIVSTIIVTRRLFHTDKGDFRGIIRVYSVYELFF